MLGMVVPWGEERSIMIYDFFSDFLRCNADRADTVNWDGVGLAAITRQ